MKGGRGAPGDGAGGSPGGSGVDWPSGGTGGVVVAGVSPCCVTVTAGVPEATGVPGAGVAVGVPVAGVPVEIAAGVFVPTGEGVAVA
jgi:hypothetical protein